MKKLIGNFEDLPEKDQMEIVEEIANEGLPEKTHVATMHNGEKIYRVDMESFGWVPEDAEEGDGLEVFAEESLENNTPILNYWDGNNWKMDYLESEPVKIEFEMAEDQPEDPEPAYYEMDRIKINGEEIDIVSSNVSGNITPYWTEGGEDEEIDLAPGMSKSEIICDELMKKIKAKFGEECNSLTSLSLETLKSNLLDPEMGRSWLNRCYEVWTDDKKNVALWEECGDGWHVMTSEDYEKI